MEIRSNHTPTPIGAILSGVVRINSHLRDFWANGGWAPAAARTVFMRSRLDWQVSLSHTLKLWIASPSAEEEPGRLILGWANLGALVEGTMKFFLCVFQGDYATTPLKDRGGNPLDPDKLDLGELCKFFAGHVWIDTEVQRWEAWVHHVRRRRNAVHAYQNRDIGTVAELCRDFETYLDFLLAIDASVPYPDEEFAYPADIQALREQRLYGDIYQ